MGKTNGAINGRVGNVIYYTYRGKPCCRSVPSHVRQTTAITVVALCLRYEIEVKEKLQMVTDMRWLPGSIIGSCFGAGG